MAKILVVEDNEQLSDMLTQRLERRGHSVVVARDHEVAFSSAKAANPAVIVLDSQSGGDENWTTTRALKYDEHTRAIPIIVLMANDTEEARARAMQNGADALHGKPVDLPRLLQAIDALVGEASPGDETSVSPTEA